MNLPLFYAASITDALGDQELEEENAKHVLQVLRMKPGQELRLTDGKGIVASCTIISVSKKNCTVTIWEKTRTQPSSHQVTIAISLLKNAGRFEWFLEKASETGISRIVPLVCNRTERQMFRESRLKNILVSAMLQSQQSWLTELSPPAPFLQFIEQAGPLFKGNKFIAHCLEDDKTELAEVVKKQDKSSLILIGPEGDFTQDEIKEAVKAGFQPVNLGETRLRSETAGITAAILLRHLGA